ncbi:hypothetical protein RJ639_043335 [Escallonia herrerae]|uniref:Bifunctional inhibitor/plant lipid transfer protein/seed storage helical domain-containing protein n=1 Tax=Escallonia herrerae TaxID=1293975 RepID=A0AA88WB17_9ASTE|nr:hypothetical protein RJ639_043335 [Escallonia herrerae]
MAQIHLQEWQKAQIEMVEVEGGQTVEMLVRVFGLGGSGWLTALGFGELLDLLGIENCYCSSTSAAQCKEERRIGLNACKQVLHFKLPTPECCQRVRVSHVECVYPVITSKLHTLIDLNKAIRSLKAVEGESLVTSSVGVSTLSTYSISLPFQVESFLWEFG